MNNFISSKHFLVKYDSWWNIIIHGHIWRSFRVQCQGLLESKQISQGPRHPACKTFNLTVRNRVILWGTKTTFCYSTVTLNSNLASFKIWNCFQLECKWIIWAYNSFARFKRIFLRYLSLSNAKWFYGKKRKIWNENLYLTVNPLSRNKMWCAAFNHNIICEEFFGLNYNHWLIFTKLPKFSHKKIVIFNVKGKSTAFTL